MKHCRPSPMYGGCTKYNCTEIGCETASSTGAVLYCPSAEREGRNDAGWSAITLEGRDGGGHTCDPGGVAASPEGAGGPGQTGAGHAVAGPRPALYACRRPCG